MRLRNLTVSMLVNLGLLTSSHALAYESKKAEKTEQSVFQEHEEPQNPSKPTILETLNKAGQFKTLAAALKEANLLSALEAEGPFTVFAPTDRAFAKLGQETLSSLLADKETLSKILLYHVVPSRVSLLQALYLGNAETLNGAKVNFRLSGLRPKVNNSAIILPNVSASNGVIHVVDTVLIPPMMEDLRKEVQQEVQQEAQKEVPDQQIMADASILDLAATDDRFSTLVSLLQSAGVADTLRSEGPFTVFAPTNEAFAALSQETLELLKNDPELLRNVLMYHVVSGAAVNASQASALDNILMANGEEVNLDYTQEMTLKVNNARVIQADITAANGIIHVIDSVLIP